MSSKLQLAADWSHQTLHRDPVKHWPNNSPLELICDQTLPVSVIRLGSKIRKELVYLPKDPILQGDGSI